MADDRIKPMVVNALVKDGWTITHDPLTLEYDGVTLYVDLGGDRAVLAQRAGHSIAVEVKSFPQTNSLAPNLYMALGQYLVYRELLRETHPNRKLYLALTSIAYDEITLRSAYRLVFDRLDIRMIVVDPFNEEIQKWI